MPPRHKQKEKEEAGNKHKEKRRRKVSDKEKENMRIRERERRISSNTATFRADILRVTRKTRKKNDGYNQAEAFELFCLMKKVFNEVEECERQRLLQQTEDIKEKIKTLKYTIKT